jgi:hypothetical protein
VRLELDRGRVAVHLLAVHVGAQRLAAAHREPAEVRRVEADVPLGEDLTQHVAALRVGRLDVDDPGGVVGVQLAELTGTGVDADVRRHRGGLAVDEDVEVGVEVLRRAFRAGHPQPGGLGGGDRVHGGGPRRLLLAGRARRGGQRRVPAADAHRDRDSDCGDHRGGAHPDPRPDEVLPAPLGARRGGPGDGVARLRLGLPGAPYLLAGLCHGRRLPFEEYSRRS